MANPLTAILADPDRLRRLRLAARLAFVLGAAAVVLLSLVNLKGLPSVPGGDKFHHTLAYFLVASAGFLGFSRRRHVPVFLALVVMGGALELVQAVFSNARVGDPADVAANAAGVALGWALAACARLFARA